MSQPRLRVYYGPESETQFEDVPTPEVTTIRLGEILPDLLEAALRGRAWIEDFANDEITLSADLYEVLQASRRLRPSA